VSLESLIERVEKLPEKAVIGDNAHTLRQSPLGSVPSDQTTAIENSGSQQLSATEALVLLRRDASRSLLLCSSLLAIGLVVLTIASQAYTIGSLAVSASVWCVVVALCWRFIDKHNHAEFGPANLVTALRAAFTSALVGFVPVAEQVTSPVWLWGIAIAATVTLCLDGLDGYLARRSGLSSDYGARFDMETDAFLALIITLFIWQTGSTGIWILALGLMRYAFLAAAFWVPALNNRLYPSMRRKVVCVIQVGALCLMLCPWLAPWQVSVVGLIAMACLIYSFATDVLWLVNNDRQVVIDH